MSAPLPSAGLELDGTVVRGSFALQVDLRAEPGEVVGVVGPNGAGKSTLLRTLAGLVPLTRGRLALAGDLLDDGAGRFVPAERRRVGLVFQDYRLFPHLSVLDNVAFGLQARGQSRQAGRAVAHEWLARLEVDALADRRPSALSGGQAQRVALARALATDPALLLLDEPLAALDAGTRVTVRTELRAHLGSFAGPTLLVTHDPLEALVLADRLVVLEAGRVVQSGAPAEVARRPATDYVARLVGLTLHRGTWSAAERAARVAGGTLVPAADPGVPDGAAVLVAVRPAAVTVHGEHPGPSSVRNTWPGTVRGMELLADRVRLQVDAEPPVLADVTPAAVAELGLGVGSAVWLTVKAMEVEVYPAAVGVPA
ncbi:MAG TPA: ABC transporter ATP-binding protein [Motilibacteraceae bacterium]|nr:ABC transporter ATP-binding protein [Motilibacteraceae bacterium]